LDALGGFPELALFCWEGFSEILLVLLGSSDWAILVMVGVAVILLAPSSGSFSSLSGIAVWHNDSRYIGGTTPPIYGYTEARIMMLVLHFQRLFF
jgi:hypothetical protein